MRRDRVHAERCSDGPSSNAIPNSRRSNSLLFLKAGHGIAVNGMRDLMAKRARQLFGVLHKIQQQIDDIDVSTGRSECVWVAFVNKKKLEWVVVARLRHPRIASAIGLRLS